MNIRRATIGDLMGMQNCNLHNLPEVSWSTLTLFLSRCLLGVSRSRKTAELTHILLVELPNEVLYVLFPPALGLLYAAVACSLCPHSRICHRPIPRSDMASSLFRRGRSQGSNRRLHSRQDVRMALARTSLRKSLTDP